MLKVLYYTSFFGEPLTQIGGFETHHVEDICTITTDRTSLTEADVVVFHIPDFHTFPSFKKAEQLWVAVSVESEANYPLQCIPEFMEQFDLRMTFRQNSDVPVFYFDPRVIDLMKVPARLKTRDALAVYFASNSFALNNRYELVADLMRYIKIDSCGKSQNNCQIVDDIGRVTKLDRIASYMFYLAFENSNCVDYVSEKLFDGLCVGTLPVYLGAPNVDEYLPGDKCIINASDFSCAEALARHLLDVSSDMEKYESYFAWKVKPFRQGFLDLARSQSVPAIRRLCSKVQESRSIKQIAGSAET